MTCCRVSCLTNLVSSGGAHSLHLSVFFGCSYGVGWEWGRGGSAQAAAWSCIALGSMQPVHKSLSLGAPSLHLSFFYLPFPIAHPECLRTWVKKLFWKKMQFVGKKTSLNLSCDYFWGAFRDELFQIL